MGTLKMSCTLPVTPETVFNAWMDSKEHTAFTGDTARIIHALGAEFSAFSGYITGRTIELAYPGKIVQRWRTTEFPEHSPDSLLVITIKSHGDGCKITLDHSEIPEGQEENYKKGWKDYYFDPMKLYFTS
jgi:activator of HSP90 ATPase